MSGSILSGRGSVLTSAGDDDTPGGAFPGYYASAPAAVGPAEVGSSALVARGNHQHPILTFATTALMTAALVATMLDGTPCYVASRDRVFRLATSAFVANTWDVFASTDAGRQWLADNSTSLKSARQTTWFVDTAAGDDDATGLVGAPLKTLNELSMRLNNAWLTASVTVTVTGNIASTEIPFFTFRCAPAASFTMIGVPTVIFTSTIGTVTAAAAGPGTGENTLLDAAVPGGSFTAAGALADGVIGERTNGTVAQFWFAKDNGATTSRISKPSATLANGDTYTASTLPTIAGALRFLEQRYSAVVIRKFRVTGGTWTDSSVRFEQCWWNTNSAMIGTVYANCAFASGSLITQRAGNRGMNFSTGGMLRNAAGTGSVQVSLANSMTTIGAGLTLQGCVLVVEIGHAVISGDMYVNDCSHATFGALAGLNNGTIFWETGSLVGSGNTTFLFSALRNARIMTAAKPVVLAGSSTSGTPIRVLGTGDFSVADMANGRGTINAVGSGVWYTDDTVNRLLWSSGEAAPGAVAVVMNNAPAGSPAAPARYLVVPDGLGGVYTIPSLT